MLSELNRLLQDIFKVLHIKKWDGEEDGYEIILCTSNALEEVCKVSVLDFKVIKIEGHIFVCNIEDINNALRTIRKMNSKRLEVTA